MISNFVRIHLRNWRITCHKISPKLTFELSTNIAINMLIWLFITENIIITSTIQLCCRFKQIFISKSRRYSHVSIVNNNVIFGRPSDGIVMLEDAQSSTGLGNLFHECSWWKIGQRHLPGLSKRKAEDDLSWPTNDKVVYEW